MKYLSKITILHNFDSCPFSNIDGSILYSRVLQEIINNFLHLTNYNQINNVIENINIDWKIITKDISNVAFYSESCNKDLMDRGVNYIFSGNGVNTITEKIINFINKEIENNKILLIESLIVIITSDLNIELIEILNLHPEIILISSNETPPLL
jgi:hypothetical protein